MTFEHLISLLGYPAIFLGVLIEGEMVLVLSGFAVHQGYLSLPWVIFAGFCGAFMADQCFFYLGRHRSRVYIERHPSWHARIETIEKKIDRFRTLFVLGFRFVFGFRTVSPFVLGMGDIRAARFILLDAGSILAWAGVWISLGYLFGNAMQVVIKDIEHYELELMGVIVFVGLVVWAVRLHRRRR